ncbi:MAG: malectin domain-containing carbohydrate-binding protein [Aeromicrobium sp.]
MEYYQGWGGAKLSLDYTVSIDTCATTEWSASYFAGTTLSGASLATDCVVELDFEHSGDEAPISGVSPVNYSARFVKTIDEGAGSYTFTARADDGVRVLVDGAAVIDRWSYSTQPVIATVPLSAGPHTVVVEYYQGWGGASLSLEYERQGADIEAPVAPTGLTVAQDDEDLFVDWLASASTDTVGYNVYRGTSAGVTAANGQKLNGTLVTATEFTDTTAVAETTYYYVVTAVDGAGNVSGVSNEGTGKVVLTPDTEAPVAPTGLTVTGGNATASLAWVASTSTDTVGYRVYRGIQPGAVGLGQLISGPAAVTALTYVDSTVTNGTTYFYEIVAVDLAGNASTPSNEVIVAPRVPNTTDIKVDFTATNAVPVTGYVADWGQTYGARSSANQGTGLTYGWIDGDGNGLSLIGNGRDRGRAGIPDLVDSMIHMQYGDSSVQGNGVAIPGIWEIAVADGIYEVTVAVGDQPGASNVYDSVHAINVEGSVAIERFQATTAQEFNTVTTKVGVFDGKLTIDALGGTNTKLGYVTIKGLPFDRPVIERPLPLNRALDADANAGVSATIKTAYAGYGIDPTTMQGNVKLFKVSDGSEVAGTSQTSGGSDTMNFAPNVPLLPNTTYRYVVTDGVKDFLGNPWIPFSSVFTTSPEIVDPGEPGDFTPAKNIAFEKVELPIAAGRFWASMAFGPDGKLYGSTIGQGIFRYTVNADGTLSNEENLGYAGEAMVGFLFDKSSTAGNIKLWITHTTANTGNEQDEWASGVSLLTGPNLENRKRVFTQLPRSLRDHLTNSMVYGPNDDIYLLQGSNTAAGDGDGSWGARGEKLLTAALLHFDPDNARVQQSIASASGTDPLNVRTDGVAIPYDPYAANAPLKIYATGIRNAYDLVYHSNGHLYVATNGTAGGGNSAGVTYNAATNTYTQVSAAGIPGFAQSNGRDLTAQCRARDARDPNFVPTSIPAVGNHPTQRDTLYDIVQGGYYGHPNPQRCEFVLHEGNIDAQPEKWAGQGGSKYPIGVAPDANFKPIAYDFEYNKSPNGTIEYKSATFGGQLKGRVAIVRFSNNNDIIWLEAGPNGQILGGQTEVGIPGVANTTMAGVGGFNDPLEIIENTANGNLYVNQYNLGGNQQKMYLLRVPASQQASKIGVSKNEAVFSAVKSDGNLGASVSAKKTDAESITITNQSTEQISVSSAITGANASEFSVTGVPSTLAAGASATAQIVFTPGTSIGQRSAQLTLTGGASSVTVGLFGLSLQGIEGGNEPTFANVMGTLGYGVNVGWTNLAGGMQPTAKGDEVLEPLFVKSGSGPVSWRPLAQFAPPENLGFGWYTGDGTAADRRSLGGMNGTNTVTGGYQMLLPPVIANSTTSFDPGAETFGLYYYSAHFNRYGFTEDRLNSPAADAHRARIYPAKNRGGVLIPNTYIVAYEDASNGDYQDYVFVVSGIKPVTDTGSGSDAIKVDFTTAAGDLAGGYVRDFGQAYGARTGVDQGSGLTYGWKDLATENDVNLSVGGTIPGNARDRQSSQTDGRLDSFMHMQPSTVPNFNGTNVDAFWEIALANGTYNVTVGVGDPNVGSDAENHRINLEGVTAITGFTPSGAAGSSTRHTVTTREVVVADGFLTVDPIGGTNTKIGFIDIVPVEVDPGGDDPSDGAQVKVTFQTTDSPVPAGWTADSGAAFTTQAGFGWLNQANNQPADRSNAVRYRTTAGAGITFPTDPRQQGFSILDNSTVTTITDGVWEYVVPNGTYEVAVSVGDAQHIDSAHGVLAEGQPVVNNFVPSATTPFQVGVRTVTVTDGRLSLTSGGTNTKVNWVSIKGDGLEPNNPTAGAKISFRTAAAPVPAGWTADTGAAYSSLAGFGWLVNGAPTDRSTMTRYRTSPATGITYPTNDPTRQGLILMQATTTTGEPISGGTVGVWEYALANGSYTVSASAGDAGFIDSVHGVAAEGTPLITNYTPTGAAPFATGTATVLVTDGKLTLTATGVNTKLNWVTIQGQALQNPVISVGANGSQVGATYSGGTAIVDASAVAATGSTIASLSYTVNGGTATPYTAPFTLENAGNYTVVFTAVDSGNRTTTRTVQFEVLNIGGTLKLTNQQVVRQAQGGAPLPGLYEDVLVMHRVNSLGTNPTHTNLLFQDTATVALGNTGTKDLRITSLTLGGPQAAQFELVNPPTLPLTIAPGQTANLTTKFIATSGSKGVRTATVTVASSDPTQASKVIKLRGGYMGSPEGNSELTLQQIFTLFDSTTSSGSTGDSLGNGSENPGAPMDGDEVRSLQWKRLDTSKPVQAVQLGAFHGCCGQTENFNINGASATHAGAYGQAIYPLKSDGTKTAISTSPGGNFNIVVAGQTTNQAAYMAIKMWPVKDAAGKTVPGAWFAGHDYIQSASQCGTGPTNCDFQDNVYLITNALPVTSSDTTAPAAPAAPTGTANATGVNLSWTASTDSDLIGYRVERSAAASGPWTNVSGTGLVSGTTFRDTTTGPAAITHYRVVAVDASGNATAGASGPVDTSAITFQPLRFNAGGPAITVNGVTWAADPAIGTTGYRSYTNPAVTQINGTTDDALYFSTRSDNSANWGYDIPVPNGTYLVRLHFVEVYYGAPNSGPNNVNARRFHINIENGQTGRQNYSILQDVGPVTLDIEQFTATVTDGKVDIDFSATANQPQINAFEIIRVP